MLLLRVLWLVLWGLGVLRLRGVRQFGLGVDRLDGGRSRGRGQQDRFYARCGQPGGAGVGQRNAELRQP